MDVNRVSKGSPTGRISQFSALTVAGNKNVSDDKPLMPNLLMSDWLEQQYTEVSSTVIINLCWLQGIIGLGMGKANGIGDAIKKANRQVRHHIGV